MDLIHEVIKVRDAHNGACGLAYVLYMAGMGYGTDQEFKPPKDKPWVDVAYRAGAQADGPMGEDIDAYVEAVRALAEARGL